MRKIDAAVIREPDDPARSAHISLGRPREKPDAIYLVFRGTPEANIELLEDALLVAQAALPTGRYKDKRGRPQG